MTDGLDTEKVQKPKEFHVGFADFSEYIASDDQLSLYKSFASLGARNLLYPQAELQVLEKELKSLDDRDQQCLKDTEDDDERRMVEAAARAWEGIQMQSEAGNERERRRMDLILRIRKLMKEYGEIHSLSLERSSY